MLRNIIYLATVLLLTGCLFSGKSDPSLTLSVAIQDIYCAETASSSLNDIAIRTYTETQEQLKEESDITLEIDYFKQPQQLEKAILSGKYNASISKPWQIMRLNAEARSDFQRIADLFDPNNNIWLTGIVIVPAESPIQSLNELSGKRIGLGKSDSYENYQAAMRLLANKAIAPGQIIIYTESKEIMEKLLNDEVDAAVVSDYTLSADATLDFANPDDFRILAHTEMIPLTSLLLDMNKFTDEETRKIKKALLSISSTNAPLSLVSKGFSDPWAWTPKELKESY